MSASPVFPRSPLILSCLAATWFVWGSTYLALRFALVEFPPFFLMSTRFLFAGGLLFLWLRLHGAALPTWRQWQSAAIIGALLMGGGMGGTAYAELSVGSGLVVAFIAVTPLMLVMINLLFRVFPTRGELLAVVVGLIGVLMLTRGQGFRASPIGLIAMTVACLAWSTGSVLIQRGLKLAPGPMGFATEMLCGGALLLTVSAVAGEPWHWPTHVNPWLAWWYLVVFGSLIAFSAYMVLLARTTISIAASYTFVNPVVALLLGVTWGAEVVTSWEWLSAGVIVIGVLLLLLTRR